MSITLATTWNPRGEFPRFKKFAPLLVQVYEAIVLSFPPAADPQVVFEFQEGSFAGRDDVIAVVNDEWSWGRYIALQQALTTQAGTIHYADMDRLLRWVETRQDEWRMVLNEIQASDCLVIGRTPAAYASHPQALRQTEAISNAVVSHLLGEDMDVSAGSKGFSRAAAEFLVDNTQPRDALGADAEWPILLKRAGFKVKYRAVDGLDWESADRYQDRAADSQSQLLVAEEYDANPANWEWRVQVAQEIVRVGIETSIRPLNIGNKK